MTAEFSVTPTPGQLTPGTSLRFSPWGAAFLVASALAGCEPGGGPNSGDDTQRRPAATVQLAEEPILSIGVVEGPEEYQLVQIAGAAHLADGSIVAADRGAHRVQKFGPAGEHLWTRGREGEGPVEFQGVELIVPCTNAESIVAYDIYNWRVTVFDGDGNLIREYPFAFQQLSPREITCAPSGRLVVSSWGTTGARELGPHRTKADIAFSDSADVTLLRERIPAEDRIGMRGGSRPGIWSRKPMFAANDLGVWLGTGDDYEIEFLDWTGTTTRRIRWEGPDLTVTPEHLDTYRENLRESYSSGSDPDWRPRFEARWDSDREILPSFFPAYVRVLLSDDGVLWIQDFLRPGEQSEWFAFEDGEWIRTLELPPRTLLLDIGANRALVRTRDAQDVQRLAVHELVEG